MIRDEEKLDALAELIRAAINRWPEYDRDKPINGGDMVEWFGEFRERAKATLAEAGMGVPATEDEDEDEQEYRNFYKCDRCKHEWEDVWTAMCDDDCPSCGMRHMTPYKSEDV